MSGDSVVHRFYRAFGGRDWRTMGLLYADDARFSDPAFPDLNAREVRAMWRMLVTRGTDLRIEYEIEREGADAAQVHWIAHYTFGQTGRKVTNDIRASMVLRDGLIRSHTDVFNFHRWTAQALGPVGLLLGWLPSFQRKVQAKADAGLRQFIKRLDEGQAS
jgi:ketosteroid isomerase-like protein